MIEFRFVLARHGTPEIMPNLDSGTLEPITQPRHGRHFADSLNCVVSLRMERKRVFLGGKSKSGCKKYEECFASTSAFHPTLSHLLRTLGTELDSRSVAGLHFALKRIFVST